MPDIPSTDLDGLCDTVAALLGRVAGVSKVESRMGGAPAWAESRLEDQSFWEMEVVRMGETLVAGARMARETPVVRIEGYLIHDYGRNTAATFRRLIRAVRHELRQNPTLGGFTGDAEPPQLLVNDRVVFDADEAPQLHHCTIEVEYICEFAFDPIL